MNSNLFAVYGGHKSGDCPIYNVHNARIAASAANNIVENIREYKIQNILGKYHTSEHNIVWIIEADNTGLIKDFFVKLGLAEYNAIKVVPITTFDNIAQCAQKLIEQ